MLLFFLLSFFSFLFTLTLFHFSFTLILTNSLSFSFSSDLIVSKKGNEHKIIKENEDDEDDMNDGDDGDDDGIVYDGELEIHHSPTSKSHVSKLYSTLLQSHYENHHINVPTIELAENSKISSSSSSTTTTITTTTTATHQSPSSETLANTNNPIHNHLTLSEIDLTTPSHPIPPHSPSVTLNSRNNEYSSISTLSPSENHSKRGLSTTARFQRFVVSKMAATPTGQDLMTQALNEEGQMIINWLIAAVKKCNFKNFKYSLKNILLIYLLIFFIFFRFW